MDAFRQKRAWFWVAIGVIVIALVALLVPHGNSTDQSEWLALLPVFFIGLLVPLKLLQFFSVLTRGRKADASTLASSFQRPPPVLA